MGETTKREREEEEEKGRPAKKQLCGKMTESASVFAEVEEGKTGIGCGIAWKLE